ncbi:MAG: hypothetical protein K9H61_12415 [Bacteroidia bacterium]|nr:hypothetical protein [Bacteroidia bacterium]MCF8447788.1 hypothetical protein [Bacteroidia bacterium]
MKTIPTQKLGFRSSFSLNSKPFSAYFLPVLLIALLSISACKKESTTTTPDETGNGLPAGVCRITSIDSTFITYYSDGKPKSFSEFNYTYTGNEVKISGSKSSTAVYVLTLNATGFPEVMSYFLKPTDTAAYQKMYFTYNADTTLNSTRTYIHDVDKYYFFSKDAYTWTNRNLTRIINYGTDTTTGKFVYNMSYDLTKKDTRKYTLEKLFLVSSLYYGRFMPGVTSINLIDGVQEIPTGGLTTYNTMLYEFDSKNNVTKETYKDNTGPINYSAKYKYECN